MPGGGRIGRIFAWDPEIFRRFGDDASLSNSRHFINVLGCLHNLVESGNLHIRRTIDRFRQEVLRRLERELNGSKRQSGDLRPYLRATGAGPVKAHPARYPTTRVQGRTPREHDHAGKCQNRDTR